jgi:hypothetical protein
MDVTLTDLQIDGIHCGEAAEFLGQAARFQHELWFHWVPSNLDLLLLVMAQVAA